MCVTYTSFLNLSCRLVLSHVPKLIHCTFYFYFCSCFDYTNGLAVSYSSYNLKFLCSCRIHRSTSNLLPIIYFSGFGGRIHGCTKIFWNRHDTTSTIRYSEVKNGVRLFIICCVAMLHLMPRIYLLTVGIVETNVEEKC